MTVGLMNSSLLAIAQLYFQQERLFIRIKTDICVSPFSLDLLHLQVSCKC